VPLGDATKRFAVVEMDWDRIRAVDLLKLFSSFTPRGSTVVSVKIIPSEFGKERLAQVRCCLSLGCTTEENLQYYM
jgi:hypothetical protein